MKKLKINLRSLEQVIALSRQKELFRKRIDSKRILSIFLLIIVVWQAGYYLNAEHITNEYRRKDAGGFAYHRAHHFLYFFYYLGLFPVVSDAEKVYSEEGAAAIIEEKGETLMMEYGHWSRLGESARIWAFLPDAWLRQTAKDPSITLFNSLFFLTGLLLVFAAFWRAGLPLIGFLLVLFIGSNPFYLFETYANQNIFSLSTSVALILLALYLPVIFSQERKSEWLIAVFAGVLIGFACNVRAENLPVIVSCVLVLAMHLNYSVGKKLLYIALLVLSYYATDKGIKQHFDRHFEEAYAVVEEAGGHPYTGDKIESHRFWHPVFCGLGDYDRKYGYEWNDIVAYKYAIPVLKEKYNLDLNYSGDKYYLDQYYDADSLYYVKFDEIDAYEQVMKEKVLGDINRDPFWYIDILLKRVNRILDHTSPVGYGFGYLDIRGVGWLIIPLLLLLVWLKQWNYLKILIFTMPLLATSLIIYSKGESTYSSPYHLIMLAVIISFVAEGVIRQFQKRKVKDG